jgi:hypothetical protein
VHDPGDHQRHLECFYEALEAEESLKLPLVLIGYELEVYEGWNESMA